MLLLALTVAMAVGSPEAPADKTAAAAAPAPLVLPGAWLGREVGTEMGVRYPKLTFLEKGGTLAYEDAQRGTGIMSVRIEGLTVSGSTVRFSVRGPGGRREYRGRWDGSKITGTMVGESAGTAPGTFELTKVIYDDSPRLPFATARAARPSREGGRTVYAPTVFKREEPQAEPLVFQSDVDRTVDREQQAGLRLVGYRLSRVSGAPQVLESMMDDYGRQCSGAPDGTPLYAFPSAPSNDCDRMVAQMAQVADAVNKAIEQAEDEARRARMLPGVLRDLRSEADVAEGDWDRATSRLRDIQAAAARRN